MRLLTLIFTWTILVSCSRGQQSNSNEQQSDKEKVFTESLRKVRRLSLPLTLNSRTLLDETKVLLDNHTFDQDSLTINPYGICLETDKYFGIIYRASADIFYPELVTVDKSGNHIDSLMLIDTNENDPWRKVTEYATIFSDRTIVLTDSVKTTKEDSTYNQIQPNIEITISRLKIDDKGKILIKKE